MAAAADPAREPHSPQEPQQPGQGRTSAPPARALDDRALRTLFFDLLGRPPLADERQRWLGRGRHDLLEALLGTRDFWAEWWEAQLYYFLLIDNFRPESETARAVPGRLQEGRLSVRDALHRIALTPTFDLRNPGADTFVTVVMEQFLGVTVQNSTRDLEIGKAAYDGRGGRFLGNQARTQSDVVRIAVEHPRAARHFIAREYRRILKNEAAPKLVAGWARDLHRDPDVFLEQVRGWLMSGEYDARLEQRFDKSNRLFVRGLFVDTVSRLPTPDEIEPMRNALDGLSDPRPLRSVLVRLLLDSRAFSLPAKQEIEDPTAWIADLFRRLLGREAAAAELEAFVGVFHEADCRPQTVVYAILSHPEYQVY